MNSSSFVLAVVIAAASAGPAITASLQERPSDQLRKAIVEEEANQDSEKAVRGYRQVVKDYDESREAAGTALFRLAESCRKAGQKEEAERLYRRVVREFGDRPDLVRASRVHLPPALAAAESGADRLADAHDPLSISSRERQRRQQLELEVRQLQQKIATRQRRVDAGVEADDVVEPLRKVLAERVHELSETDNGIATTEAAAERIQAERQIEYARRKVELASLSTECHMLEERMRTERQKVAVGVATATSDSMIALQRQVGDCQARLAETQVRLKQLEASLGGARQR